MSLISKKIQLAAAGAGGGGGPAALFEIDVPNPYGTFLQWDSDNQQYIGHNRQNYHKFYWYGFDIEGNQNFSIEADTGYQQYSEYNSNNSMFYEGGYNGTLSVFCNPSIELISGAGRPAQVYTVADGTGNNFDTSSSTGSWRTNASPQYGTHFYSKGGVSVSGNLASSGGGICLPSFGSGSGSNSATAYYHFGNDGGMQTDKAVWSGSSRDYPSAVVGSYYANVHWANSIGNNPGQYNKGVISFTRSSSDKITHNSVTGKTTSNTSHYMSGMYADPRYSQRCLTWLVDVDGNAGRSHITSWDFQGQVRDQICLDSASSISAPSICAMFQDAVAGSNNVYIFFQDPTSNYTYYLVHWLKDDNTVAVNGGGSNTGGSWNYNGTAKKFVFDSAWKANNQNGMGNPGWGEVITSPIDGETEVLSFALYNFSIGGKPVIFNLPKDFSELADQTVSGVVTISSGSSVNSEVAAYLQSQNHASWGGGISRSTMGGGKTNTTTVIRNFGSTSTVLNTEYL